MEIVRPTYLINPDICKANIRFMLDKASRAGVAFRPHFKTHQSRQIGRWFRDAGVSRITVSSLSMADYFQRDGWNDITVAFPVNVPEIDLINRLAGMIRLGLLIEDLGSVSKLERELVNPADIYIKIDSGYHRTGLEMEELPEIRKMVEAIHASRRMNFKGLITHAGHTYQASGPDEIKRIAESSMIIMREIQDDLKSAAPTCILSVGDTPSCSLLDHFPGMDEIRPGNFVFYDLMQRVLGSCAMDQVAGIMVCPVAAVHPRRNQAVLYGGAVHFSKERIVMGGRPVYGQMVLLNSDPWALPVDQALLVSLSQEHGILEAPDAVIDTLKPGMCIGIIPVHACLTANLMRGYYLTTDEAVDHYQGS
jgi:D-serine deaminase-like pyridoxal phosphate-dependent protein